MRRIETGRAFGGRFPGNPGIRGTSNRKQFNENGIRWKLDANFGMKVADSG
jgi:hypothetical protein